MFNMEQHNDDLVLCPTAKSCCRDATWSPDPPPEPGGTEHTTAAAIPSKFKTGVQFNTGEHFLSSRSLKGKERNFFKVLKISYTEGHPNGSVG